MNWFVKQNRRAATRHRYDGGDTWIQLEGSLVRQCQVLDLSRTGVRLRVANAHSLPYTFKLLLSKNSTGRPARVRWRRDNELGAEFFKADSSSTSQSTACAPRTNSSSVSRSTPVAAKADSSSASRSTCDAPSANSRSTALVAAEERNPESQKPEAPMSTLSRHAEAEKPHVCNVKADAEEVVDSISNDEIKRSCQMCDPSEQLDSADQKKNAKQRMDLSRLQNKLGPKHIALIHALNDIDPESPHGQELALIIESLD